MFWQYLEFGEPKFLLLIILIIPLFFFSRKAFAQKTEFLKLLDQEKKIEFWHFWIQRWFFLNLAVILLAIGIAQPSVSVFKSFPQGARSVKAILLFDLSYSMSAKNQTGLMRLDRAKRIGADLVDELPDASLSIAGFTNLYGSYSLYGQDLMQLKRIILEYLDIESVSGSGSDIGNALNEASGFFLKPKSLNFIFLFSDGENTGNADLLKNSAKAVGSQNIKVVAIGVGETEGTVLPVLAKDGNPTGKSKATILDEKSLKEISRITGGRYFYESDLRALKNYIKEEVSKVNVEEGAFRKDWFKINLAPYFIIFALFCWIVSSVIFWR